MLSILSSNLLKKRGEKSERQSEIENVEATEMIDTWQTIFSIKIIL